MSTAITHAPADPESPGNQDTARPGRRPLLPVRLPAVRPRTGTMVAATLGAVVSLAPALLPRTPTTQGLLTGVLVALFVGLGAVLRMCLRRSRFDAVPWLRRLRAPILGACLVALAAAVVQAERWQNGLRAAMGFPDVGIGYWLTGMTAAALVAAALVGLCRAARWVARRAMRARGITLGVVAALAMQAAMLPAAADWRRPANARADVAMGSAVAQPVSATRSASDQSAVSWAALSPEGPKFLAAQHSRAIRVYVALAAAPNLSSRVALAMRELERSGGLNRSNIVAMVPTGSGWIDAHAATGMDERFGGDVAMVALQYSDTPSWVSFLFDRRTAQQTSRALFAALEQRLSGLEHPPHLYIYGQSLGATAGSSVFTDDADQRRRVCAAVWAGPPADRVHRSGATILANSSDPVVQWSPELLWHAPNLGDTRPDAPHPRWIPLVSFIQTSTDLLSALAPPPGHGHRYGTDQGTTMGTC